MYSSSSKDTGTAAAAAGRVVRGVFCFKCG
jgi:hypothetical protein